MDLRFERHPVAVDRASAARLHNIITDAMSSQPGEEVTLADDGSALRVKPHHIECRLTKGIFY